MNLFKYIYNHFHQKEINIIDGETNNYKLNDDDFYEHCKNKLDYNIKDELSKGVTKKKLKAIMTDLENLDMWDYDQENNVDDVAEYIALNSRNNHPRAITSYFRTAYPGNEEKAFYEKFLLPFLYNKGAADLKFISYIVNQMRFTQDIPESEIYAIYVIERFSSEIKPYNEEDDDIDEENEDGDDQEDTLVNYDYDDLENSSIKYNSKKIWQNMQLQLLPNVFETYYHGTTLSRAKQALPELSNIMNKV
jgi:hypothetical protein